MDLLTWVVEADFRYPDGTVRREGVILFDESPGRALTRGERIMQANFEGTMEGAWLYYYTPGKTYPSMTSA